MTSKGVRMERIVVKWGNNLAVRLPAESARRTGVGEGDTLIAEVSADGRLVLALEGRAIGKAEVRRLRRFLGRQKEIALVVGDLLRGREPLMIYIDTRAVVPVFLREPKRLGSSGSVWRSASGPWSPYPNTRRLPEKAILIRKGRKRDVERRARRRMRPTPLQAYQPR